MSYFPIFVDMQDKHCLVYGGGTIAARRIQGLLRFGAQVTVIASRIAEDIRSMGDAWGGRLQMLEQGYRPGQIQERGCQFVFSCVDDRAVDLQIYQECKERGIPVNIASDQSLCDFYIPALVEQGEIVIGISSGGRNHGLVRKVASRLREWLDTSDL